MKKFCLLLLFFFAPLIQAEESSVLTCPRAYATEITPVVDCSTADVKDWFLAERSAYQAELLAAHKDTSLHPNVLAPQTFDQLKRSKICYETICQTLFNNCARTVASNLAEQRRYAYCQRQAQVFFNVQLLETKMTLESNVMRKQRALSRERFRQLEGKMSTYLAGWYVKLINRLTDFDSKFTNFTLNPL